MNVAFQAIRDRVNHKLAQSIYDNPVVTKELRTRMRGKRAFMMMGAYIIFLSVVLLIAFYTIVMVDYMQSCGMVSLVNNRVGLRLFVSLAWTQAILLLLIIPSLTSGAVTLELERKTIEMLALTRLTPGKIVLGKHLSGFLYSLVLLLCSLPLSGICLMFGGISPLEMLVTYVLLIGWAFLFSAIGVFWSSLFLRTATAALFAYGTCGAYTLFTYAMGFPMQMSGMGIPGMPNIVFIFGALNPCTGIYGVLLSAKVCGISVPISLAALILHIMLGSLMLLIASTHVKHYVVERALSIRVMLLAITGLLVWFFIGNVWTLGMIATSPREMQGVMQVVLTLIMVLLCAAGAIMATGELKKEQGSSMYAHALGARRTFTSSIRGAVPFMILWSVLAFGVLNVTLAWVSAVGHYKVTRALWDFSLHASVMAVAVIAAVSAVGVFASSLTKIRRSAAALVILFIVIAFFGYLAVLANYQNGISKENNPLWQAAAFWPMTPILTMNMDPRFAGDRTWPLFWWPDNDSWRVVSVMYVGIGLLALALAPFALSRTGGVKEE